MKQQLSVMQRLVFNVLGEKPNTDIPISVLYGVAHRDGAFEDIEKNMSTRTMQQTLGPLIARINAKLKRGRIEPGELKRTYRLNTKKRRATNGETAISS